MNSPLLLAIGLVLASSAAQAADGAGPADAQHAPPATAAAFQFGPRLAAPAQPAATPQDGPLPRRLLTRVDVGPVPLVAARRERPYASACNFTTGCR